LGIGSLTVAEDVLEIHSFDAENRGIREGDRVSLTSRAGNTTLHDRFSERMQHGVAYTTFHHGFTGANVVTTESEDWATGSGQGILHRLALEAVKKLQ
jgi:formate dehydrogenase major subunit